jgi:hypothetical protein
MRKILFLFLFCFMSSYLSSQTIVKLKLPDNCKSTVTGIDNNIEDAGSKIEIIPNPSSGIFTIAVSLNSRIEKAIIGVYNSRGESVFNENVFSNTNKLVKELNLTGLQPGIYIFNIKNTKEVLSTKLVINNQ